MTSEDLIKAGYRRWTDTFRKADWLYQKCMRTEDGTKRYYINVYLYDLSKFNSKLPKEQFSCKCQFEDKDERAYNIEFSCTDLSIQELEDKVEWIFTNLEFCNYGY